jgi:hypothetical protein
MNEGKVGLCWRALQTYAFTYHTCILKCECKLTDIAVLGCADTKNGIPSVEALLQHKVREANIDEIVSKVLTL